MHIIYIFIVIFTQYLHCRPSHVIYLRLIGLVIQARICVQVIYLLCLQLGPQLYHYQFYYKLRYVVVWNVLFPLSYLIHFTSHLSIYPLLYFLFTSSYYHLLYYYFQQSTFVCFFSLLHYIQAYETIIHLSVIIFPPLTYTYVSRLLLIYRYTLARL